MPTARREVAERRRDNERNDAVVVGCSPGFIWMSRRSPRPSPDRAPDARWVCDTFAEAVTAQGWPRMWATCHVCILELYIIVRDSHTMERSAAAIRIDAGSSTPAYRQISDAIRALLVAGSLNPGDLLPPVRQLAMDLAVHFNTVAEAYRTLAEEGWLDLRRRRGALVIERPTPREVPPGTDIRFGQRLRELVAATQAEGLPPTAIVELLRRMVEGLEQCS